jgi:hypothetical protein
MGGKRVNKIKNDIYEIVVAGGTNLKFSPLSSCGHIEDGVGFNIGDGWWVIEYKDLVRITKTAEKRRKK